MLGRLVAVALLAATCALVSCEPPKVVPRCPGFEEVQCDEGRRTLCVVIASDGCQECVCERKWTDIRTDPKPAGEAAGGEGEGEGEGEADEDSAASEGEGEG